MNVDENLMAENVTANDTTAIDATTNADANMAADANMTMNADTNAVDANAATTNNAM
jgi:hypothetical protein